MTARTDDPEEEMVPKETACPRCGERRVDELILHEDDSVDCISCGNPYSLSVEKEPRLQDGGEA